MLHGDDEQRLAEIERHLSDTDPAFAERFRRREARGRTSAPTAGLIVGLALFVIGAATGWWVISLVGAGAFTFTIVALWRTRRRPI